eukprot:scaffold20030_cov38-Attheya_sp.AAC.1
MSLNKAIPHSSIVMYNLRRTEQKNGGTGCCGKRRNVVENRHHILRPRPIFVEVEVLYRTKCLTGRGKLRHLIRSERKEGHDDETYPTQKNAWL